MSLIPHKEERVVLVIVAAKLKSVGCFPVKAVHSIFIFLRFCFLLYSMVVVYKRRQQDFRQGCE